MRQRHHGPTPEWACAVIKGMDEYLPPVVEDTDEDGETFITAENPWPARP